MTTLSATPVKAVPSLVPETGDGRIASDGVLVSFIIPAWNEQAVLAACLASIRRLHLPEWVIDYEVIVVDNQSTDDTAAVALAAGARVVTVEPGRASRARNAGAAAALGHVLAFVDADCELDADWLVVCGGHLRSRGVVAAGTSLAIPRSDATWVEKSWFPIVAECHDGPARNVSWLASFNMLVPKDAFALAGAFDESLETCEDCDFGYRLGAFGRLVRDGHAATVHHGESKSLKELMRREAWRGRGNVQLLRRRGINLREGLAVAIPLIFSAGLAVCSLGAAVALARQTAFWPWLLAFWGVLTMPLCILLAKRVLPPEPVRSAQCVIVYGSYLVGRAIGFLLPVRRVARGATRNGIRIADS